MASGRAPFVKKDTSKRYRAHTEILQPTRNTLLSDQEYMGVRQHTDNSCVQSDNTICLNWWLTLRADLANIAYRGRRVQHVCHRDRDDKEQILRRKTKLKHRGRFVVPCTLVPAFVVINGIVVVLLLFLYFCLDVTQHSRIFFFFLLLLLGPGLSTFSLFVF